MTVIKFNEPLFIIGNPRSGTSLLRLILTSHSQVVIPPECGFIIWLNKKYSGWGEADNNDSSKLMAFLDDLFLCKKFETWSLDRKYIQDKILSHQPTCYAELCKVIYVAFGMAMHKDFVVWGDKNNFHINHLDELLKLYPNARFLHIVRDGRDVACSYREVMADKSNSPYAPKLNTDISEIASEWFGNVIKVDSFIESMPGHQVMTIRYEDLVLQPSSTIASICEWLSLSFETDMLNFYQQNQNQKLEPELTMDWKKRTKQPISDDTIGRYAAVLSETEKIQFLSLAGHALKRFSYV